MIYISVNHVPHVVLDTLRTRTDMTEQPGIKHRKICSCPIEFVEERNEYRDADIKTQKDVLCLQKIPLTSIHGCRSKPHCFLCLSLLVLQDHKCTKTQIALSGRFGLFGKCHSEFLSRAGGSTRLPGRIRSSFGERSFDSAILALDDDYHYRETQQKRSNKIHRDRFSSDKRALNYSNIHCIVYQQYVF